MQFRFCVCPAWALLSKDSIIIPVGASPIQASWRSLLVSRKVAARDCRTEGSETTKSGTDEQKRHTEAKKRG